MHGDVRALATTRTLTILTQTHCIHTTRAMTHKDTLHTYYKGTDINHNLCQLNGIEQD